MLRQEGTSAGVGGQRTGRPRRRGPAAWFDRAVVRAGARVEAATGVPAFASLSSLIAFVALLPGLFVLYSDIAVHIDFGRDTTLITPSHGVGVAALHGMLLGALIAVRLYPQEGDGGLRLLRWRFPYGAAFALSAGLFTLIGFPFDFTWHELFGEDVTLWGPSHLQLIGGGALSVLGFVMLSFEARRFPGWRPTRTGRLLMSCGVLAGPTVMSVFMAEFDFGIPQFQALYLPTMVAFVTATTFTFARLVLGRGGALAALAVWLVLRAAVFAGIVALDMSEPRFYPYLVEALLVEAVFLSGTTRPLRRALLGALAIGTLGCVATLAFSHVWAYNELPWHMLPASLPLATLAALAGATLAVGVTRALAPGDVPAGAVRPWALALAAAAAIVAFTLPLPRGGEKPYVADIDVQRVNGGDAVLVTARFDDPSVLDGAEWFDVFAWQGGARILHPMEPVGGGRYRTPVPIPITGEWKSMLRIADGTSMRAAPIRFGFDTFVKAPPIPAADRPGFAFRREQQYLMREYRGGPRSLIVPGYLLHLAAWIVFFGLAIAVLWRMHAAAVGTSPDR
jgi:hypothetical protein